ncbi:MAG TPA: transcriptional regulator [Erwinia persicina]|nr:transcriptional regulator [Erwinia persicina]
MNNSKTSMADIFRALGNEHRLVIVEWLADPRSHFPEQQDGDLVKDGVCVGFITEKIGLSQPTVTGHLQNLAKAGIVTSKRIKNWVF